MMATDPQTPGSSDERQRMPQIVTSEQIVAAYKETGSVWKAAKRLGIAGQSVHDRMVRLGHPMPSQRWTDEEHAELRRLAGQCTLSEIVRRLGRPYGSVATKLSALGLTNQVRVAKRKLRLRGTGFNSTTTKQYLKELMAFDGTVTRFCRQRGLDVDILVKAAQHFEPDFWKQYTATKAAGELKRCEYCNADFYPANNVQRTCSRRCQAHARNDRKYFNGQRKTTIGLSEGVCQICLQEKQMLASHHVWGREHDPQAEFLIAVCRGCHQLIGMLASTKFAADSGFIERTVIFALMRRHGARRPPGYHCYVDIDELTAEEAADDSW